MKNKFIKEIKKEIKEINASIDSSLFTILDTYQELATQADEFYLDICELNKKILLEKNEFINNNIFDEDKLNKYFEEADLIIEALDYFKVNTIEEELLDDKLKEALMDDLCKVKLIELNLRKIDKKTSLLCGSISLLNIFKKLDDFCGFVLKDFKENYEDKIYNIYENTIEIIESYILMCDENTIEESIVDNSTFLKNSAVPSIYKNKRLSSKDLSKIALENDFILSRHNGDHDIFKHKLNNKIVVIPYKGNTTLAPKTQQSILNMIFA